MRDVFTSGAKLFVLLFAIGIFITLNEGVARAEVVEIHGVTLGSFNSPPFSSNPTLFGLSFNGTSFPNLVATVDTVTAGFTLAGPTINLGSFTLSGAAATYTGNTFTINLTLPFANPVGSVIDILNPQPTLTASLTGVVQSLADGSVFIDFENTPTIYTVLLDGIQIGAFSLTADDVTIKPGETANIVGHTTEVPEPTTMLLLTTGLAGLISARRYHSGKFN